FSNRIEILNAGGLMQAVDPAIFTRHGPPPGFRGRRTAYRNEAISEAMRTYGYVQKFGTGVPKIRNALAARPAPRPRGARARRPRLPGRWPRQRSERRRQRETRPRPRPGPSAARGSQPRRGRRWSSTGPWLR